MTLMHASVNMGCQGKSGPGKIHEVILVLILKGHLIPLTMNSFLELFAFKDSAI